MEHLRDRIPAACPRYCGVHSRRFVYIDYATGEEELYDLGSRSLPDDERRGEPRLRRRPACRARVGCGSSVVLDRRGSRSGTEWRREHEGATVPRRRAPLVAMAFTFGLLAWAGGGSRADSRPPCACRLLRFRAPPPPGGASHQRPVVIGAAGDIACASEPAPSDRPDSCQYDDTADLLDGLTAVLVLGDGQYETGDYDAYVKYYGPTWGRYRTRTFPAPGNHEYTRGSQRGPERLLPVLR